MAKRELSPEEKRAAGEAFANEFAAKLSGIVNDMIEHDPDPVFAPLRQQQEIPEPDAAPDRPQPARSQSRHTRRDSYPPLRIPIAPAWGCSSGPAS
jgi:hypothetical protein